MEAAKSTKAKKEEFYAVVMDVPTKNGNEIYSVVLKSWIVFQENRTNCYWPRSDIRKCIKNLRQPEKDWNLYQIEVIAIYSTYEEALRKQKNLVEFVSSTDEESTKKVRKSKKHTDFRCASISPPPSIRNLDQETGDDSSGSMKNTFGVENNSLQISSITRLNNISTYNLVRLSLNNQENNSTPSNIPLENISRTFQSFNVPESNLSSASGSLEKVLDSLEDDSNLSNTLVDISYREPQSTEIVNHLSDQVGKAIKLMKIILQKVNTVEEKVEIILQNNTLFNQHNTIEEPLLPLMNIIDIENLEEKIKNDEKIKEATKQVLIRIHGKSERDCIYRVLSKLFHVNLSPQCSWAGRHNNFTIRNLEVIKLAQEAVRSYFPLITESNFENSVKD